MSLFHVIEQNGPSTFEKASELHAETPKIQVPNVQATSSHDEHVRPSNFTEENTRSSLNNQIFSSTEPGSIKTTTTTNHPGFKSSGTNFHPHYLLLTI